MNRREALREIRRRFPNAPGKITADFHRGAGPLASLCEIRWHSPATPTRDSFPERLGCGAAWDTALADAERTVRTFRPEWLAR
jgi:hypothetical protein